jgi:hypothetical protein
VGKNTGLSYSRITFKQTERGLQMTAPFLAEAQMCYFTMVVIEALEPDASS